MNGFRQKGPASSEGTNARHLVNAVELLTWYNEHLQPGERGLTSLAELWRLGVHRVFAIFTKNVDEALRGARRLTWGTIAKRLVRTASGRAPYRLASPRLASPRLASPT